MLILPDNGQDRGLSSVLCYALLHMCTQAQPYGPQFGSSLKLFWSPQPYFWEVCCKNWDQTVSSSSEKALNSTFLFVCLFYFLQQKKQFWVSEARTDPHQWFPRKSQLRFYLRSLPTWAILWFSDWWLLFVPSSTNETSHLCKCN